ncbi:MAG: Gfo/Idh/MocA family oxidoreductase, partial [Clostridia bacterium]|nr:Gfo/Idh/MocA family oxidoreductase [Clostridia bacterium]
MAKKNAVVIGFGGMGGWHCHFQRSNDVVNLKGVYDIKPERNKAAEEIGIYAYPSFEAVLADPEVDFLVIAVPNDMHKPLAIAAMAAGKHVISEKPVTLSSADLQEM